MNRTASGGVPERRAEEIEERVAAVIADEFGYGLDEGPPYDREYWTYVAKKCFDVLPAQDLNTLADLKRAGVVAEEREDGS